MKLRLTAISDTHNKHNDLINDLPGGDILIHSGDFTSIGRQREVESFVEWFNNIDNYTHKFFIAGNHDLSFDSEELFRKKSEWFDRKVYEGVASMGKPQWLEVLIGTGLNSNVYYLENSYVVIDDVKIWGSPYSPTFGRDWAFNVNRGDDAEQLWNQIPSDADIVITHSPIYGYCDRTYNTSENVGCADLYRRLLDVKPHLHFCGHVHEAYGYKQTVWGYTFNASGCSLEYFIQNKPITFEYNFSNREIDFV